MILVLISILSLIQIGLAKNMNKIVFKRNDLNGNKEQYFDGNGNDEQNNNEIVIRMKLNQKYEIECPLLRKKNLSFKYILFNNSIYDANKYYYRNDDDNEDHKLELIDSVYFLNIKSKTKFDLIFDQTKIVSYENTFEIDRANVNNSGRYYCVYSYFNEKEYFVSNRLHLVFDGKFFT
jgi:hypothetical protein